MSNDYRALINLTDDSGMPVRIVMSLEEAERLAKSIAKSIHLHRTGKVCDDVGFVYWRKDEPDPVRNDALLISVAGNDDHDAYVGIDTVNEYPGPHGWFIAFENHDLSDLNGWAKFPEPSTLDRIPESEEEDE